MSGARLDGDDAPGAVGAVVVTYHPDGDVAQRLRRVAEEAGPTVVVDNGSPAAALDRTRAAGVELLDLGENIGLAAALNRGVARLAELGCSHAVLFDQDSSPRPGMVAALWRTRCAFPDAAIVGPRIVDAVPGRGPYRWVARHPRIPGAFRRVTCEQGDLPDVTGVITSGSLVEIDAWRRLGGFDEALFIDYVDNDFCLRAIAAGRTVAVSAGAVLEHRLGSRTRHEVLGHEVRPTHHSPLRHYYIARNRVRLWRRHALRHPSWAAFDAGFAAYNLVRMLAFEDERRRKLRAMMLGTWDGLRGRGGPCPDDRQRALQG
jgi:rhamnosyltransferase